MRKEMKSCELCKLTATTYCESDQASLCWGCDAVVHGANFLVARHVRSLLCHGCQSLTPWRATGSKLGHTVSVCERCVNGDDREESEAENDGDGGINNDDEGDDDDDAGGDPDDDVSVEDDVEDGDNQVVPWSSEVADTPPPASSSSSGGDYSAGEREVSRSTNLVSLKRSREIASDLHSQDDPDRLSLKRRYSLQKEDESVSVNSR
ncbi:(3S,6E)-nerolidol synthase 2 [Hibiscus syriacus]|uniref:(3S,6E)-nerolidol synthase 2 n=1 Tax=Hibiscus syriacus TaxID=106335 RepID=A0A6A2Z4L3_HIBSY|nr:zinc finger protein CONSTANS-LIKE 4-like [Hibiscus syriacus]KAE8686543.1 (3S,6E)-nerolidol synthase 2 [Hibiscus syriacus]